MDFGMFDWIDTGPQPLAGLYESRLQLIERADEAGFYGYHLAEHHGTPLGMAPSPSLFFAALSQRTQRIRFSPMAYLLPMYHPVRLIEEICMLDQLSGGRMEIGVSRGVSPYEIRCFNVDPEEAREIFSETLDILRLGMTSEVLNYDGKHFRFNDVPIPVRPVQQPHPPIWYPSFSQAGVEFAAGNGFSFMSLGPPALVASLMAQYREIAAATGANAGSAPRLGAMRQIFVAETDAEAMAVAEPAYADWYRSITQLWHQHNDHSFDEFFEWNACLAGETILIGSVDKVREQIRDLIGQSDINYFVGSFAWGSLTPEQSRRSLDLFIDNIMPAV